MTRNPGISKIVGEDVIRIVYERGEKTPLETVEDEIKIAHPLYLTRAHSSTLIDQAGVVISCTKNWQQ